MIKILNYINGEWVEPKPKETLDVINPATGELIARTPLCAAADVEMAVQAAKEAYPAWRRTPAQDRVQYLFKLKFLMEGALDEISRTITDECGKTYDESKAEMRRAIENVEVAGGIPMMMKGEFSEDIAPGIDEFMIRQPVGVCATICPFNFPGMIAFWYLPYAIACGNTYIIKPSEKVPVTMQVIFRLIHELGLPKGVVNLVNGGKQVVDAILDHPDIRAITFVGFVSGGQVCILPGCCKWKTSSGTRRRERIRSSSFRTQTWRWQPRSWLIPPSAVPVNAAWRYPGR